MGSASRDAVPMHLYIDNGYPDIIVVSANRTILPSILKQYFAKSQIKRCSLEDFVKIELSAMVPKAQSVWFDLPPRGLPHKGHFFSQLSELVGMCQGNNISVVLIMSPDDTIDGMPSNRVPSWVRLRTQYKIVPRTVCSCQMHNPTSPNHHLRKLVWAWNVPYGILPAATCTGPIGYKLSTEIWCAYYRKLVEKLWCDQKSLLCLYSANRRSSPSLTNDLGLSPGLPFTGRMQDLGPGAQRLPDSSHASQPSCPLLDSPPGLAGTNVIPNKATAGDTTQAYPTDSKVASNLRKKAAKEAGTPLEVKKKLKHVENHWDDCGEDLSSIFTEEDEIQSNFTEIVLFDLATEHYLLSEECSTCLIADQITNIMLLGRGPAASACD